MGICDPLASSIHGHGQTLAWQPKCTFYKQLYHYCEDISTCLESDSISEWVRVILVVKLLQHMTLVFYSLTCFIWISPFACSLLYWTSGGPEGCREKHLLYSCLVCFDDFVSHTQWLYGREWSIHVTIICLILFIWRTHFTRNNKILLNHTKLNKFIWV